MKTNNIKYWQGMEKLELSFAAGGRVKWYNHFGKLIGRFFFFNTVNIHNITIIYPREMKYISTERFIHECSQ